MVFMEMWHDVQTEGDTTRATTGSGAGATRSNKAFESTPMFDAVQLGDWKRVEALLTQLDDNDNQGGCGLGGGDDDDPMSIMTCGCLDDDDTKNMNSVDFEPSTYGRQQASTWVTGTNDRNRQHKSIVWKQLPIHAAICSGAPTSILRGLVKAYPEGLQAATTPNGNLPLHLAIQLNCHSESDILFLLTAFPGALKIKNKKGLVPSKCGDGGENLFKSSVWSKYQLLSNKQYVEDSDENDDGKQEKLKVLERTSEAPPKDLKVSNKKTRGSHRRKDSDNMSPELMAVLAVDDSATNKEDEEEKRKIVVFPGLTAEGRKERKSRGAMASPTILTTAQKEERKIMAVADAAMEPKVVKVKTPKKRFGFWTKRSKRVVPS